MSASSKNLGQVAGLYIGTSAPTNKALIWYDTSSNVHKTFDVGLNAWTVLQPQTITPITYSALISRASGQGLTQGQWFKITDRSNALALAITATKVQYVNNNGVPVVDDLGTQVMYNITSENLIIDDVTGVYDATTNKLTFSFSEVTPVMNTGDSDVDYVLGEQKRGSAKTLRKFRLSSLLSAVTGNDISWNGGFFLNFYNKLKSYFDTTGGVASHAALQEYKTVNNQAIQNIAQTTQQAIQTVGQNIEQATSPAQIYSKQLPTAPTEGVTADIAQGDTLQTIVQKVFRWINKFKKADGINMPSDYSPASIASSVNNNDTVSSAIGKLSKFDSDLQRTQVLPCLVSRSFVYTSSEIHSSGYDVVNKIASTFIEKVYFSGIEGVGPYEWATSLVRATSNVWLTISLPGVTNNPSIFSIFVFLRAGAKLNVGTLVVADGTETSDKKFKITFMKYTDVLPGEDPRYGIIVEEPLEIHFSEE